MTCVGLSSGGVMLCGLSIGRGYNCLSERRGRLDDGGRVGA